LTVSKPLQTHAHDTSELQTMSHKQHGSSTLFRHDDVPRRCHIHTELLQRSLSTAWC